jgi:hypothetical protein
MATQTLPLPSIYRITANHATFDGILTTQFLYRVIEAVSDKKRAGFRKA